MNKFIGYQTIRRSVFFTEGRNIEQLHDNIKVFVGASNVVFVSSGGHNMPKTQMGKCVEKKERDGGFGVIIYTRTYEPLPRIPKEEFLSYLFNKETRLSKDERFLRLKLMKK